MARGYKITRTHLSAPTASQPRCATRQVEVRPAYPQTRSVVWCAEGVVSLSATRRCAPCAPLGLVATTVVDDIALVLRDRPRVHRGPESVEPSQGLLQRVAR
jgi:hypothetical protein